ncbi:type IV pilus biogenesis/stability protein PilW [Oleiagrimonas soli]|uniref:Pilus assembly protein PilW n=1 Tax=Oleiagrimonas soli TaxID=1543381 RepID=A0A099CWD1_9GAMM|nr:type IV pilus biogenesis/stability protein PilW [Oleiagrimonas soli]KGI78298.1 pilus assembly protein PilW [Oleiagrimonas soli]MBB6183215.1 type IV pilus assembly protein PilF [Oleiagrimonas soli]
MRLDRWLISVACALVLAGCATSSNGPLPARKVNDQDAARIHTELGQQYLERGQLKRALEKLQKALQFDEQYVPAHTVIATIYARIGETDQAEKHFRRAEELDPKSGDTNNNLGVFLCRIGKIDQALPYFQKATQDPFYNTKDVALSNAGRCELKRNNYAAAIKDYRLALAINPNNADALYQMADALLHEGKAFRARAFIQRFDALGRPDPSALLLGYRIEKRLGDEEGAQSYAKRLRAKFPDSDQAQSINSDRSR